MHSETHSETAGTPPAPRRGRSFWGLRIALVLGLAGVAGLFLNARDVGSSPGAATLAPQRIQGFGHTLDALTGLPAGGATVTVDGKQFVSASDGIYSLSGLKLGEKVAVVTRPGSVPTAFHFSVYANGSVSTSVHTPPAYLVPKQPAVVVPAGGGVVYHGQHELSFTANTVAVTASLTGFGEHPGTPPPPVTIPAAGAPKPPRPPIIPKASTTEQAFPQSVFNAEVGSQTAQVRVPLIVPGADPLGRALPLLLFNTGTGLWERAGNLSVVSSGFAEGPISKSGLYMVVTVGRILTSTVSPTGETTDVVSPFKDEAVTFTIPAAFEIDNGTSSDVRPAVFWIYGWREGKGNLTGVRVDFAPTTSLAAAPGSAVAAAAEPGDDNPCPPNFSCPEGTTPCIAKSSTVNGCGAKTTFGGVCTCCKPGTACQAEVKSGGALDTYDISIGIEEIMRQIKAKGEKRKEDMSARAGCFAVATQ